jgi:hypothetical protein
VGEQLSDDRPVLGNKWSASVSLDNVHGDISIAVEVNED